MSHNKLLSSWYSTITKKGGGRESCRAAQQWVQEQKQETGKKGLQEVVVPLTAVTE